MDPDLLFPCFKSQTIYILFSDLYNMQFQFTIGNQYQIGHWEAETLL